MPTLRRAALAASLLLAPLARAQVDYVNPTIGNVGILLEPTRPSRLSSPTAWSASTPSARTPSSDQIRIPSRSPSAPTACASSSPSCPAPPRPAAYDQRDTSTPYALLHAPRRPPSSRQPVLPHRALRLLPLHLPRTATAPVTLSEPARRATCVAPKPTAPPLPFLAKRIFDGMKAYVYGEFSAPVTLHLRTALKAGKRAARRHPRGHAQSLDFRYAVSFITADQAQTQPPPRDPRLGPRQGQRMPLPRPSWNQDARPDRRRGRHPHPAHRLLHRPLPQLRGRMVNITEDGRYYSGFDHQRPRPTRGPSTSITGSGIPTAPSNPSRPSSTPTSKPTRSSPTSACIRQSGIMPTFADSQLATTPA